MYRKWVCLQVSVLALAMAGVAAANQQDWEAAIKASSPLHWYKFNEATGTDCLDSGSAGLNGTYDGVALDQDGFFGAGTAVAFNRTGQNRVNFANATDLPGPWTVEYIVETTKPPAGNDSQVLHDSDTVSIRLAGWTSLGEAGFTRYGVADYRFTPTDGLTLDDLVIQQNVWMHLVWRNDGSGMQLFFDGKLVGTSTNTIDLPRLRIGARGAGPADWFQGVLDEAVVFDRALSDADIIKHAASASLLNPSVLKAANPSPASGDVHADTWVSLGWSPGAFAVSHDVYLGDNFDDVNAATTDSNTFRGNQTGTFYVAGFPGYAYPDGLVPGTTYYWRIDEVNEADPNSPWKGDVWSFFVPPRTAYDPSPANGAKYIATDASLSWTAGFGAKLHTVYFGDNPTDVNSATGGATQATTDYDPGPLEKGKTYYWRVDEFDGVTTYKGDLWSFTTLPNIAVSDPNLVGWWKLDEGQGTTAVDWSGHDNHGTVVGTPQWVAGYDGGALQLEGSNWVDCDNGADLTITGPLTIACWVNPAGLTGDHAFAGRNGAYHFKSHGSALRFTTPGVKDHDAPDAILQTGTWQHVAVTFDPNAVGGAIFYINGVQMDQVDASTLPAGTGPFLIGNNQWANQTFVGMIDDVRVYNKVLSADDIKQAMRGDPLLAWDPSPVNGATVDIDKATPLSWSVGQKASQHDVYFGTDRNAVVDANASDATGVYRGRQNGTTYIPPEGVEWGGGPYYWRIDEVNNDGTISTGRIWSFSVADYLLIDDFESYNSGANQIWYSWHDGLGYGTAGTADYFAGNGTGSAVGEENTRSFTEETIVHGGRQSMPFAYDNNKQGFAKYSEAELTLTSPRDWTKHGVGELSLWFRGLPGSVGSFVEAPAGTYTMTAAGSDIWNQADQFHYAYKTLTGVGSIQAQVLSVDNTNVWAKAGVMIRETLDAGSKFAAVYITPGNGCRFQARVGTDVAATSDSSVVTTEQTAIQAPYWVKLERDVAGNFRGYYSADGTKWTPMAWNPQAITMGSNIYIGLALTAHNTNATCTAKFSNVSITGTAGPQWADQDVGIASNAREPLYVAVSNTGGQPAVVTNPDPNAATTTTWTQWVIPLSQFSDQGINLTNVDTLAIGLGTRGNTTVPGGSGTMYFDDIRLYRPQQ
jgi:Concanavalin A-like lectin/glucanases superfamily